MTSPVRPAAARPGPPDQAQRERALDPRRSIIVQAPAGSGKTDLLTRRFLRLLADVNDPAEVVAITFTKAAAAEMRHRILAELEKASAHPSSSPDDEFAMETLAARALVHSKRLGWNLLELPGQLRISTIDSFCREIALERPLLTSLGGGVDITEQPDELYRRAARNTLRQLGTAQRPSELRQAIEALLQWRDNNWQELEDHLVTMLRQRDRWMQEFWLRDFRDDEGSWNALRERLERPFARAVAEHLAHTSRLLMSVPGACEEAHALAQFACSQSGNTLYRELAEIADFPHGPFPDATDLDAARQAYSCLAQLVLTNEGGFRAKVDKRNGFPPERKREKQRHEELVRTLATVDGLADALHAVRDLPPAQYTEEDWRIVRACFVLLRHAAAELQVAFAEAGTVDFIEIAQIALRILEVEDRLPSEAALRIADGIRHLLVDEFQDTSRRQHRLIGALVGAWPDTVDRSVFVVGDPMQSIYFFRDADAELFPRVQNVGLELPNREPLPLEPIHLESNFRTRPELVARLNNAFQAVFDVNDGSTVRFSPSQPARPQQPHPDPEFALHLRFAPQAPRASSSDPDAAQLKEQAAAECDAAHEAQTAEIVALIRSRMDAMEQARARGEKYRISVLGRARAALAPIAQGLRDAAIPFRAVDLEQLGQRPEVLDALALARALQNAEDRAAWLGALRAPWCALSLDDLHVLASADDPAVLARPLPSLMPERKHLLSAHGQASVDRLLSASAYAKSLRAAVPGIATGTWLQQVWLRLGGSFCVDAAAHANLELLWRCLDRLPASDIDLTSPALAAALEKLTALPDPDAEADCGVHLMTIHKSKGLEFEVVIVPDLQARSGSTWPAMFGWLERGVETPDESGEITEFLIAPFQPKGIDRGQSKKWVDDQYRAKESQETRRILYVAATRAREELHLFARLNYQLEHDEPILCDPAESLLSKAWPALEDEVRHQFEAWKTRPQPADLLQLAAATDNKVPIRAQTKAAVLHRLPADFQAPPTLDVVSVAGQTITQQAPSLYQRHEGGLMSRARGSAVHLALEHLARFRSSHDWDPARARLENLLERLTAQVRATGIDAITAQGIATETIEIARRVLHDPVGAWILSSHADAEAEVSWTGILQGTPRTVQADRVFRAGETPLADESHVWWIIDYKTHSGGSDSLETLRAVFRPQLDLYASVLRKLHGPGIEIRAGLYYPRMLALDWWVA